MTGKPRILIVATGGTIASAEEGNGLTPQLTGEQLTGFVPEIAEIAQVDVVQAMNIDSTNMRPADWQTIGDALLERYEDYDGFVVLHGTDTMAYTASALSYMLENLTKPVILTGSQLPIGQLRTDGKENLITSIEIAMAKRHDGTAMVPEVGIYFNGHLMRGNRTTKQSADNFNAFESFNYPHLADAGVNIEYHAHRMLKPDTTKPMTPHFQLDCNVIVFTVFPGIREDLVRRILETPTLRSIVMRTFGSGNAPQATWLIKALEYATSHGKVVVNISQCMAGCVEMGRYDTGYQLKSAGVISGYDSTVESAVTKLMYLQARYTDNHQVRTYMMRNIRGEMTI